MARIQTSRSIHKDVYTFMVSLQIKGLCCILKPTEVLYVPQYWFAHVQVLENDASWVVLDLKSDAKLRSSDCIALQVTLPEFYHGVIRACVSGLTLH